MGGCVVFVNVYMVHRTGTAMLAQSVRLEHVHIPLWVCAVCRHSVRLEHVHIPLLVCAVCRHGCLFIIR